MSNKKLKSNIRGGSEREDDVKDQQQDMKDEKECKGKSKYDIATDEKCA